MEGPELHIFGLCSVKLNKFELLDDTRTLSLIYGLQS